MLSLVARRAARSGALLRSSQALLHSSAPARYAAEPEVSLDAPQKRATGSPKVIAIVDQITSLNMLEVSDMVELLKERLGMQGMPMMGMSSMMAAPAAAPAAGAAPAAAAAPPAAAAAKSEFDVKLDAFDAANKIKIIKEVRAATGLGLKEAKDLVESAPAVIKKALKKEEAEALLAKLKESGATASLH